MRHNGLIGFHFHEAVSGGERAFRLRLANDIDGCVGMDPAASGETREFAGKGFAESLGMPIFDRRSVRGFMTFA